MSKKQNTNTTADKRINSRLQETPIAIVGMASVFAESKNLGQFWDTIVNSVNGIQDVPEDRWAIDDYYSADKKAADKTYCKRGAFLPEIDFDPMEFGLPPNLLELTDITQLMALVVARDVLADAGIDENNFDLDKVGITLGVGGGQKQGGQLMSRLQGPVLEKVLKASGLSDSDTDVIVDKFKKAYIPWEENSFPGMLGNVIAGRIANRFNLGGTNCVVDAACAGSLAAIKMAVSDLLEYRSDMMISGGICCDNSPFMYMSFSKTPAFTDGDCIRPFDDKSNGMMIGEGVGMIVLKRLEDAERDGDRIYSVIKGIGSSSDGKFKSIYAPRPEGQLKALKRAYEDAGFDPKTCGLIEAHGTGTKAGDAAEFRGLELLFSENNDQKQHVALGSVKSQVGHTKAAAGTAGLIKAALALHHKVLPATINVDLPNQNLDIENTPLYINSETRPWMPRADGVKRQAGISSFGFGGTNFHLVLEEYASTQEGHYRLNEVAQSFLIAADDKKSLINLLEKELTSLKVDDELQPYAFNQLVDRYKVRTINADSARCGFVAKNAEQALQMCSLAIGQLTSDTRNEWATPTGLFYREEALATAGKVVALFSGQGSQYVNMGRELVCHFPTMMASQVAIDQQFNKAGKDNLSSIVYPIPVFNQAKKDQQALELRQTEHAQPAIGSLSVGLFNTLKQAGFKADFAAGHSFGELTALWAADVISEVDYMQLAMARGQAMSAVKDNGHDAGKMAAVIGSITEIETQISSIKGVTIANYNANNQAVIAGASDAIEKATAQLTQSGFKVIELPVSAAFHTPLVAHAQAPFANAIDAIKFNKPNINVYANATGTAHSDDPDVIKSALKDHILQSVQFSKEIENLYDAGGRIFVEFGPKNVLTRLVDNILADKSDVISLATNNNPTQCSDVQLRIAAIHLAVLGIALDDIDPYSAIKRPSIAPKKSPLAMKLSGATYVSPKTSKAFEDALNDNWKITNTQATQQPVKEVIKEVIVEKVVEKIVYVDAHGKALANQPQTINNNSHISNNQQSVTNIEDSVEQFIQHQSQLLAVHQAYLEGPSQYADTFKSVLAAQTAQNSFPEGLDKTFSMYHDFQMETLRVHENYLNSQTESMKNILANKGSNENVGGVSVSTHSANTSQQRPIAEYNVNKEVPEQKSTTVDRQNVQQQLQATHNTLKQVNNTLVSSTSIPSNHGESPLMNVDSENDSKHIEQVMLSVVADKTGYPTEMLELSMDMEADLGIDSIKRVEILGAVQDQVATLPELDAEQLSQMRTLAEIVDYMNSVLASLATQVSSSIKSVTSLDIDTKHIEQVMLSVVADKTGYPTEMLELSMDMEADLGIDSIKRVEILGAVQDQVSELPELDAEQLSQMRTLAEIVDYMNSVMGSVSKQVPSQITTQVSPVHSTTSLAIDSKHIEQVMLSVVADKTGYPTEMLELSMDMEADLGIDSIKRVEILGAVQDQVSELPELDAEQLSQMRTLADIVDYMNSVMSSVVVQVPEQITSEGQSSTVTSSVIDPKYIEQVMLSVVADKTGYPTEMLELSMDMEADLGIDSIKRVEILGAVQDQVSELPELDAEQLSQMRTLAEIVAYMNSVMSSEIVQVAEQIMSEGHSSIATSSVIDTKHIEQVMLSVVADKTGYPTEMLELSMDMEVDLGIDSIKRVEILGAVQDQVSELPELDAEQLSQMRTLAEIVDYMNSVMRSATPQVTEQIAPQSPSSVESAVVLVADAKHIEQVMLSVVADKTGYPTEMLELSMDMEADLGIDSIKRVEILGAVQDQVSELPELDAEQLSQMRTLSEIIDYMQSVLVVATKGNLQPLQVVAETQIKPIKQQPTMISQPAPSATVTIKKLEALETINSSVENKHLLLVNDGLNSCVLMANELDHLGWTVTVLTPSWVNVKLTKRFNDGVLQTSLPMLSEEALQVILDTQSVWQSVIYLHPNTSVSGIQFELPYREGLQLAFLLAKLSKLNKINNDARSSFMVLTRQGGDFATHNIEDKTDLIQGGLSGLVKTLAHEWENVFCRIVDVPSSFNAVKVTKIVITELNDPQRLPVEVGVNSDGRLTLIAEPTNSYTLQAGQTLDENSVFLVSGGAKGVTAHCVIELAKQFNCRFILLGRSDFQAIESDWSLNHATEVELKKAAMQFLLKSNQKPSPALIKKLVSPVLANREIAHTLQMIESHGGIAEYVAVDVCDKDNLKYSIEPITAIWGNITGVIHGAGVLADKLIENKTLVEFDQVYNTKIQGLSALLNCCELDSLEHLVLFSSAAGFYGNPAQSDYAIANEILNKVAYRFKAFYPSTKVLSFNWGPWDGGMVTPALKRMFDERGVYIIPMDAGATLLASELAAEGNRCVQIVVGTDMSGADSATVQNKEHVVTHQQIKVFDHLDNLLLADHQIDGQQVLPTVCAMTWLRAHCEGLYPDYAYQGIKSFKLLKGIVFDGSQAAEYIINSQLVTQSANELSLNVTVESKNSQGKPVFHYKAVVNLAKTISSTSEIYEGSLPAMLNKQTTEAQKLYTDGSLFHGLNLQGIQAIHQLDKSGLLLECLIDETVLDVQGDFLLSDNNVFANDLVYQALLVWTNKQLNLGSLPTSTEQWQVMREIKVNESFFIKLNVVKQSGQSVFGDILVIDENSQVASKITGAEVTCSPRLMQLFKASA